MNWPKEKKKKSTRIMWRRWRCETRVGLTKVFLPEKLSIAVNTADDFDHLDCESVLTWIPSPILWQK